MTSNGLCDGHGYCKYDKLLKQSYCYCNTGHYGSSCGSTSASANSATAGGSGSYDGHSVQLGLLITLLILTVGLLGVVGYMVFRITEFRKQQVDEYASLSGSGTEMVETVNF